MSRPKAKELRNLSVGEIGQKLGYEVAPADLTKWLKRLNCKVGEDSSPGSFRVTPPAYRLDLERSVDFVEESTVLLRSLFQRHQLK